MVLVALALHCLLWRLLSFFLLSRIIILFNCLLLFRLLRFAKIEIRWTARAEVENKRFNKVRLEHFRYATSHIFDLLIGIITELLVLKLIFPVLLHITQTLQTSTLYPTNALISLLWILSTSSVQSCSNTSLLRVLSLDCFRK